MPDNDLQKLSPAYRLPASDPDFILSDSMQGVRFLLEFAKADERLRSWGVRTTIVVLGSARIREASGDARGGGGGVSRRLRPARRVVRSPRAGADAKGPLDSPGLRRPQLLDAGRQFPRPPPRRGDLAGGFVAAAVRRGCGGSLARAGQQYRRSGGPCSRALSSDARALIEPASPPVRRHFDDHASARRAPNALSARAASTRGARGWQFYIRSLQTFKDHSPPAEEAAWPALPSDSVPAIRLQEE